MNKIDIEVDNDRKMQISQTNSDKVKFGDSYIDE